MQDPAADNDEEGHSRVDTLNGEDDALSGLKLGSMDIVFSERYVSERSRIRESTRVFKPKW